MIRYYAYQKCSTCRKAKQWLESQDIDFEEIAIREQTPTMEELKQALAAKGSIKALFNTSGMDYRALGLKDKLPTMSEQESLELLRSNGMLVKRPFVTGADISLTGFKEQEWQEKLLKV
ncbi:arsenate reductase family protein [Verrucomicrobiaceae bacterium N1E253]|uniref:Arsenate reductase family protein n=1 Tax=Oceaniferula marina TaxID=2748318 RepID=A0A851GI01_9BACT|nr:arsenate reductase family protein [Oceaniferula marina]NWK57408.1 arsenate reductase family protein [Oceaniferula marina]